MFDDGILNLVKMVAGLLCARGERLASCESLTGGLFGAAVCSVSGASDYFRGGIITYCDEVKERAGVSHQTLAEHTAISGECAEEMALSCARFTGSEWGISFTGNAGPSAQDNAPVGTVFIGVSYKDQVRAFRYAMEGDRATIRLECVREGLRLLLQAISDQGERSPE